MKRRKKRRLGELKQPSPVTTFKKEKTIKFNKNGKSGGRKPQSAWLKVFNTLIIISLIS